jgi:hypothetical protein
MRLLLPLALVLAACATGQPRRSAPVDSPASAREIPQEQARRLLLVDIHRPPYALQVPPDQPQPVVGRYKVFVTAKGRVSGVEMAGKTARTSLDAAFARTIFSWRYRPYTVEGRPVPFWHWLDVRS